VFRVGDRVVTDDGCFGVVVEEVGTTKSDLAAGRPIPSSFWPCWDRAADPTRLIASRGVNEQITHESKVDIGS